MFKFGVKVGIVVFTLVAQSAIAETVIYKKVNDDGTTTYSDTPFPGAEKVIIKEQSSVIPSTPAPPLPQIPKTTVKKKQHKLSILSPVHESTIRDNSGNFRIITKIEPSLAGIYTLDMNGITYESPTGVFELNNMNRGEYNYKVTFSDKSGKVIASSPQSTLFLQRASVLFNNR
ncbi:MAG: DUF4124 domain-containing protein [Pseudomonadota bacterium]